MAALGRVIRVAGRHSLIIWRGMQRRVNSADLELITDTAPIACLMLSLAGRPWLGWR